MEVKTTLASHAEASTPKTPGWRTAGDLARIEVLADVSIIIPTYREADNIPHVLEQINALREAYDLTVEVLFMDDCSNDSSVEAVAASGYEWAQIIERTGPCGLSAAVIDGFERARHSVLICMDGDLSHPAEVIPQMILALATGQQFSLGSRYVAGGSTDDDWGLFRYLNSRVASLLARPLTRVSDPMSGFFAMRREDFQKVKDLNPVGFKIAIELIVKCEFENIAEIPIHFVDRLHGESKLSLRERLKYIKHLRRLYLYRFSNVMYVAQFLAVGGSGLVINLLVLSLLLAMGFSQAISLAGGIAVSLVTNFALNRRFTFSYARDGNVWRQFIGFLGASTIGLVVNYSVALTIARSVLTESAFSTQLAAMVGVAGGMAFNFLGNRYVVFCKRFIRK